MTSPMPVGDVAVSPSLAIHRLIQRIRQPAAVPSGEERVRHTIQEIKDIIINTNEHDQQSVTHFCSSGEYDTFVQWMFRSDISLILQSWTFDLQCELIFPWFASPFSASSALFCLSSSLRSSVGVSCSDLFGQLIQRFVEDGRLEEVMNEIVQQQQQQHKRTDQTSNTHTRTYGAVLSPNAQARIDTLAAMPDLIANAMQTRVPYALSHTAWFTALGQQLSSLIDHTAAASSSSPSSSSSSASPFISLTPLGGVVAKMTRLSRRTELLESTMPKLVEHIEQLITTPQANDTNAASNASPLPSSPILLAHAAVFQSIGVQSFDSLLLSLIQWIGSARPADADSSSTRSRALRLILPSLYPVQFYECNTYFAQLVTKKLLLSRTMSLSSIGVRVIVDYIAFLSTSLLLLRTDDGGDLARSHHHTLLDTVLLDVVRSWSGSDASSSASTVGARVATSTAAEQQIQLGHAIRCMLEAIERTQANFQPEKIEEARRKRAEAAATKKGKEDKGSQGDASDDTDLKSLGSFASSPVVPYILTGVQSRLSSPLLAVRLNAMQLARVFSRLLGGVENELDFGEEEEALGASLNALTTTDTSTATIDGEELDETKSTGSKVNFLNPANIINPSHLAAASSSSANTPLKPHSLVDDERDLRKVPLPTFLRPALEMLQKHADSADHLSSALEALTRLVRKNTPDLPSLTVGIMGSLVTLGSSSLLETMPKASQDRVTTMRSLCAATDPNVCALAVSYLVNEFYSSSHALGAKVEFLNTLREAAEELSDMRDTVDDAQSTASKSMVVELPPGSSLVPVNRPIYSSATSPHAVSTTLAHHRRIIEERVEARTRRWGSLARGADKATGKKVAAPIKTYSINRFTPVAHLFFYPLMKKIDQPAALFLLHQHDSLLLIRLLHTVSAFLPCSSGLSQSLPLVTRGMAKVLMDYILMHADRIQRRAHVGIDRSEDADQHPSEQIGIRRMIFFVLSRILVTYNEQLFADDFPVELSELVSWLSDSLQNDRDFECRQLAQANLQLLKELLGNPFEKLFQQEANAATHTANLAKAQLPTLKL